MYFQYSQSKKPYKQARQQQNNNQGTNEKALFNGELALVAAENGIKLDQSTWYVDSGASSHVTWNKTIFTHLVDNITGSTMEGPGGELQHIMGRGTFQLPCRVAGQTVMQMFKDVAYVPTFKHQLISETHCLSVGCKIIKENGKCAVTHSGKLGCRAYFCWIMDMKL
jgi:hypothetical protein